VEALLASAEHKASVDGDLKGAIDDYQRALAAAGSNRALAVKALLGMADDYQKLGSPEAARIYQRILRDYSDQTGAVGSARSRIEGATQMSRPRNDWAVWTSPDADGFGSISPDGRFLTFTDWANDAALSLRDLASGATYRLITSGGQTQFSVISKDGKRVAYEWTGVGPAGTARSYELRVADLTGTSLTNARRLFQNDEVTGASPYDWSSDGAWIAVGIGRKDGTRQIALVSTATGSLRVLKSLDWQAPTKIFFSPDGKFIAYDLPVSDTRDERHVFVMPLDGSRETDLTPDHSLNTIMGWSPDGRELLFSSDRSGSIGLWGVPVMDGRADGAATALKPDLSSSWSLGLTTTGTLYVWKYASPVYVEAAAVDLATGTLRTMPAPFQKFIGSRGRPVFSDDGRYLAYQSCDPLGAGPCTLWIRAMDTGQLRELKPQLGYFAFMNWSPDGRELLTRGRDMKGRHNGFYRINVQTGEAVLVTPALQANSTPVWAPDGERLLYLKGAAVVERTLSSGIDRAIATIPAKKLGGIAVSPDARFVAYLAASRSDRIDELFVMSMTGGAPRSVFRFDDPDLTPGRFDWTANGTAIVAAARREGTTERALWLVPVNGGTPRKLNINANQWMIEDGFAFDRAGQQAAFVAASGQLGLEIRALENFLPARASAAKP
jgi:Tol biopolymer transport system component